MEISNLPDAEFKTLVIRMLKELNEDLNCIKKMQSGRKNKLMEMNNLQRINSRVDEAKNQINDLEHEETKTTNQNKKKKKKFKKMRIV